MKQCIYQWSAVPILKKARKDNKNKICQIEAKVKDNKLAQKVISITLQNK